ncbi:ParB N-terminal domain-containing protein [Francisella frigiditurris]|uniref:Asparaginase family protein n=1 Tax=Francisella frigiditurris TaxID=1542390 RepID=A0A1J0KUL1_9GAMM|nr:asparaginase family protein [Francisella frigiditurris]
MNFYENKIKKVSDLIPYINNSRTHNDDQVLQIAGSIKEFGFTNPILIDDKDSIIASHGRILAANNDLEKVKSFPKVEIIYEHADISSDYLESIGNIKDLKGIVIVEPGNGNIPSNQYYFLKKARDKGIVVVRSTFVRSGKVSKNYNDLDRRFDLVSSDILTPEKARIYLYLCLLKTSNTEEIQKLFDRF